MPNTGMSSGRRSNASGLRTIWRRTSRRASSPPRRSNLLMATTSAKSSMSIFSSWEARAELGGHHVEGHVDVVDDGGVALADARRLDDDQVGAPPPWPRRRCRRAPRAGLRRACGWRGSGSDDRPGRCAFMRMRSPSRAPPPLRRVGSTAMTAICSLSSWSSRKRRTSSSVSDDLPDPPVPVMPSTGTGARRGRGPDLGHQVVGQPTGLEGGDDPGQRRLLAGRRARRATSGRSAARSTSQAAIIVLIIPARPRRWPSWGEKIRSTP